MPNHCSYWAKFIEVVLKFIIKDPVFINHSPKRHIPRNCSSTRKLKFQTDHEMIKSVAATAVQCIQSLQLLTTTMIDAVQ